MSLLQEIQCDRFFQGWGACACLFALFLGEPVFAGLSFLWVIWLESRLDKAKKVGDHAMQEYEEFKKWKAEKEKNV